MNSSDGLSNRRLKLAAALRRVVDEHCEATGDSKEDFAELTAVSPSHLSNMQSGKYPIPVDYAVLVMRRTGRSGLVAELCRLVGGHFVQLPDVPAGEDDVLQYIREFTEAAQAVSEALKDGRVTSDEAARCKKELDEAIESALRLRDRMDVMSKQTHTGRVVSLRETA